MSGIVVSPCQKYHGADIYENSTASFTDNAVLLKYLFLTVICAQG